MLSKIGKIRRGVTAGISLVEVVVALGISSLAVAGIVLGYVFSVGSAQRSALYLSAGARALERAEQVRSAKWDTSSWPAVDQVVATNFPDEVVTLEVAGPNRAALCATNYVQIVQISTTPPLKRVRVDCVWNFRGANLTNTLETFRAPDQ
jgi:type II secretory pathway pseudopilin PulG